MEVSASLNFHQHIKNQFIPLIPRGDTNNFKIMRPEWLQSFLTTFIPIFFNQSLISMNMYQHAKN